MKNMVIKMGILAALLFTAACAGSGSDDTKTGAAATDKPKTISDVAGEKFDEDVYFCTQQFVDDYNQMISVISGVENGFSTLQSARNSCAKFSSAYNFVAKCLANIDLTSTDKYVAKIQPDKDGNFMPIEGHRTDIIGTNNIVKDCNKLNR